MGYKAQDDELLGAEQVGRGCWLGGWRAAAQLRENCGSDFGVDGGFTTRDGPNRAFEVEALNVFDEETTRSGLNTLRDQVFVGEGGQNDNGGLWIALAGPATQSHTALPAPARNHP